MVFGSPGSSGSDYPIWGDFDILLKMAAVRLKKRINVVFDFIFRPMNPSLRPGGRLRAVKEADTKMAGMRVGSEDLAQDD